MRGRPLRRGTPTALAFLILGAAVGHGARGDSLQAWSEEVAERGASAPSPSVVGAYATALDDRTFESMSEAGVTHVLVGFATVHAKQVSAPSCSGDCDVRMQATGWNASMPRYNLTALLSFGGAETSNGCPAVSSSDPKCQSRVFLSDPESAGRSLGQYAAEQGFDGVDFDIELRGWEQVHGMPEGSASVVTHKMAVFINATAQAFLKTTGRLMPVIAVNPPLIVNGTQAGVPLLIRAVKLLHDSLSNQTQRKQLLDRLLLSMQFYNCWAPPNLTSGNASLLECKGEGGQALVKALWRNITAIFNTPPAANVSERLVLGKPMSDCCSSPGPGGSGDYCNSDANFRIGEQKHCAAFCSPRQNWSEAADIGGLNPRASCGFENATQLSSYLTNAEVLGFKAKGVFLWRWNALYVQPQSCVVPPRFTAALVQNSIFNVTKAEISLQDQVRARVSQWQDVVQTGQRFDGSGSCSANTLCPTTRPCCSANTAGGIGKCGGGDSGDDSCSKDYCLPFQSASPGACDGSVWEVCGIDVPKPSPVVAGKCGAIRWIGNTSWPGASQRQQLLSAATCGDNCNDYDRARMVFNKDSNNAPCFIYNCTDTGDVKSAMTFAHKNGIRVVVRAGGNSFAGYSTCNGNCMVIDVSGLKTTVGPETRETMIATVGAGMTNGELYKALQRHELAAVSGTCNPVGFAGLSLGGGFGVMMRKHGLAADNIVGVEVVLSNGTVVTANSSAHQDLFWAMRGGGNGNFGIATSFDVRVYDTTNQQWHIMQVDSTGATDEKRADSFDAWQDWVVKLDESGYSQYHMNSGYNHGFVFVYNGTSAAADDALRPLLQHNLFKQHDSVDCNSTYKSPGRNLTWFEMASCLGECGQQPAWASPGAYSRFAFNGTVPKAAVSALVQEFGEGKPHMNAYSDVLIDGLGGQVAKPPANYTAFAHRKATLHFQVSACTRTCFASRLVNAPLFSCPSCTPNMCTFWFLGAFGSWEQYNAYWNPSVSDSLFAKPDQSQFLYDVYASTGDDISSYAYRNYPQLNLTDFGSKYYGDNYPKLRKVKEAYDPNNKLWYAQSVELPDRGADLTTLSTYAYFTHCDCTGQEGCTEHNRSRLVDACRKDLLGSPFDAIIFGFANGANTDPFALSLDFQTIGVLSASFADDLRAKGKRVVLSFGGGDGNVEQKTANGGTTWSYTAAPRTFTALWNWGGFNVSFEAALPGFNVSSFNSIQVRNAFRKAVVANRSDDWNALAVPGCPGCLSADAVSLSTTLDDFKCLDAKPPRMNKAGDALVVDVCIRAGVVGNGAGAGGWAASVADVAAAGVAAADLGAAFAAILRRDVVSVAGLSVPANFSVTATAPKLVAKNTTRAGDWAKAAAAFARGNNAQQVVFDGIDWDIEESHALNDPESQRPADQNFYKAPLGDEVLTSASGLEFLAELIVKTREELDASLDQLDFTIAIQPAYFAPSVQTECAARSNASVPDLSPVFPLQESCPFVTLKAYNCWYWLFSQFPQAKEALDGMTVMLYAKSNMNVDAWKMFYDSERGAYDAPAIAQSMAESRYIARAGNGTGAIVQLGNNFVTVGMQVTQNSTTDPLTGPAHLSAQLANSSRVTFKGVAIWQYGRGDGSKASEWQRNGSCLYQQFLQQRETSAWKGCSGNVTCLFANVEEDCYAPVGTSSQTFVTCIVAVLCLWAAAVAGYVVTRMLPSSSGDGDGIKRPGCIKRAYLKSARGPRRQARKLTLQQGANARARLNVLDMPWLDIANEGVSAGETRVEDLIKNSINHERDGSFEEALRMAEIASQRLTQAASHPATQSDGTLERQRRFVQRKAAQLDQRVDALRRHDRGGLQEARYTYSEDGECHYTAIMGTSSDFENHVFKRTPRGKGIMICVTMYNEDGDELESTLLKIARSIHYIQAKNCSCGGSPMTAAQWEKSITVVLVCDGREKLDPSAQEFLAAFDLFDANVMAMALFGDTRPSLHLFEGEIPLIYDQQKNEQMSRGFMSRPSTADAHTSMQVLVAIKERNAGKLSSHAWGLEGIGFQLDPSYVILVDCGTKPTPSAIFLLVQEMERNRNVGGVCGEIAVDVPFEALGNVVIGAQHFEYKISHIMDKALESTFGFVTVLPGAFSAYRFDAIRGAPLDAYFKAVHSAHDFGPAEGNMYLAEDRILCFELLAKSEEQWLLHYVKGAVARTDVPDTLVKLVKQRRRWLNGSFFALLHALRNVDKFFSESAHSWPRKAGIALQIAYLWIGNIFVTWMMPALFYLVVDYVLIVQPATDPEAFTNLHWLISAMPSVLHYMEDLSKCAPTRFASNLALAHTCPPPLPAPSHGH